MSIVMTAALGWALAAGTPAAKDDAKNYSVDVSGTTDKVQVGSKGKVAIHLRPGKGYKVNEKGPLKLELSGTEILALEKSKLVRSDAQGKVTSPKFACGFDAQKQGKDTITVDATFVLCDVKGTICEMKKERVEVAVRVEP